MMIKEFFVKHKIAISVILVFLMLVIVLMIVSIKTMWSATLDILVIPTEAKVLIDGQEYENGIYERMFAKTVRVEISLEGFETQSFDLELKRDETTRLYTYLDGNDAWYAENMSTDMQYLLDIILEYRGELETADLIKKYSIMAKLPIVYEGYFNNYTEYISYRIDGGKYNECKTEFCIKITDISGGNYERALRTIRDKGYNPDDYEIIYEDVTRSGHAG